MALSNQPKSRAPVPRIYLMTPQVSDAAPFAGELAAALERADVAAVLMRLAETGERTKINNVKALAPLVQDRGIALILHGDLDIVARGGADGAHLTGIETFLPALQTLKPDRIAGCGGLATRHDAMAAAEQGADYVMFGDSRALLGDARTGARPLVDAVLERVGWWAEVFQIPCVAVAASLDEVAALAAAGADFIAVGDFIWSDPRGAAAALADAQARIAAPEVVA